MLRHFCPIELPRGQHKAHDTQEWINKNMHNYSISLGMKRLKNPPLLINTQHYSSRLQYAAYGGRRRLSRLSSILRVTHAQEIAHCRVYWQSWKVVDCVCKSHDLEIVHVCYTISRLAVYAISRFEHNLRILRVRNTIPRLYKFSDCAEHFHSQTVRVPIGGAPYKYAREGWALFECFHT